MATAAGIHRRTRTARARLRGIILTWWVRAWGGSVGTNLNVGAKLHLVHHPTSNWRIGSDVVLGVGIVLDVWPGSALTLGDRFLIMHYSLIGVTKSIEIGTDTQVAEHCTLRDQDHDLALGEKMNRAAVISTPVKIGSDVWIGRGVAVLKGARIHDHAVVAANAVVRSEVPAYAVAGGIPAKVLRLRNDQK